MSSSKISSVLLYILAAVSLLVILFFYLGPRTVDIDELETRVEELTNPGDMQTGSTPADTTAADTTAADTTAADTTASEEMQTAADTSAAAEDTTSMATTPPEDMGNGSTAAEDVDLSEHLTSWELMVYKRTDYALAWAYILLIITALAALVFPLINVVTNPRALLQTLALLAGAAVLILVAYVISNDTPIQILGYAGTDNEDPVTLKWVGTALFTTYMLFGLAILSILYSEIAKMFK